MNQPKNDNSVPDKQKHPKYRNTGIGLFPIAYPGEMGFHVEDLFPKDT